VRPSEVARRAADYLARHDVAAPRATAEILLADVLGTDRTGIYTREAGLTSREARRFGRALCLRCTGTPVQHLTSRQAFRRLELLVRPGVFIPRPETERLVDVALELVAGVEAPTVVDVGTGTGAVALAIADERRDASVWATDVSEEAVDLAERNAERLGLRLALRHGDLLDALPDDLRGTLDLVVSNPPYVDPANAAALPREVLADPPGAVFGRPELTGTLLRQASAWLRPGGGVAVEIEDSSGDAVVRAARDAGFAAVTVHRDLNDRDRVVAGRRP
jgi:release factor glutamine methyltransferase